VVRSPEGVELLLPAIQDVVQQVMLAEKRMVVRLLPGLREIGKK
jgi:ribosomal 30S subunit maturation factor RimM